MLLNTFFSDVILSGFFYFILFFCNFINVYYKQVLTVLIFVYTYFLCSDFDILVSNILCRIFWQHYSCYYCYYAANIILNVWFFLSLHTSLPSVYLKCSDLSLDSVPLSLCICKYKALKPSGFQKNYWIGVNITY